MNLGGAGTLSPAHMRRVQAMAAAKKLAKFNVAAAGEDFRLHIEDDAGHVLELSATRDQVDVIADKLDELLSEDDSADEIDAGEEVSDKG